MQLSFFFKFTTVNDMYAAWGKGVSIMSIPPTHCCHTAMSTKTKLNFGSGRKLEGIYTWSLGE
uniref:Uncharacterized protein n=1 Tax=Arundo donax TaxID=35708 RepID=A0A0A9DPR0_ARUDO